VKGYPKRFISGHHTRGTHVNFRHGGRAGQNFTPEYSVYVAAKRRCNNPNCADWPRYGGRGIKFLFASFEQFLAELGPRPAGLTLDRIDNDGHYASGNVRWATRSEQRSNRRDNHQLKSAK